MAGVVDVHTTVVVRVIVVTNGMDFARQTFPATNCFAVAFAVK